MRKIVSSLLLFFIMAGFVFSQGRNPAKAQTGGGNLLRNPGFEGSYSSWQPQLSTVQMAADWTPWWVNDLNHQPIWVQPEYKPAEKRDYPNRVFDGDRAQQYFTFHRSHYAGVYQQVTGVTPGVKYRFSIMVQVWSSTTDKPISELPSNPRLRIGIDPTGAAWPGMISAPPGSVVWSDDASMENVLDKWGLMTIDVVAQNNVITVYLGSSPDFAVKHNDIYMDGASLVALGEQPRPTNTPRPAGTGQPRPTNTPRPAGTGQPARPTNTPWPTNTRRPSNSTPWPTATRRPGGATATPRPGGGGGGAGNGAFELGGQTHTFASAPLMADVGMKWVKFQHKWSEGESGDVIAGRIADAKGRGFKVLMSIPGANHSNINFGRYVEFLRSVASLPTPPDAIEVWNEQNIDREWPTGQIKPEQYVTQMLKPAYQAIKGANSSIMVISGAPAPTGYFGGGCTPQGCDDKPYIEGMFRAGAASYSDCIGIHYNEGILPPSQRSGDPRGNGSHYTRYFWGMVDTYWGASGGARKLCFTELGYLSGEGYGALPAGFAWANDTSVAEHAAWLGEAVRLSRADSRIRMLIIFNVDFTHYDGSDPQAGFAMVRPGNACPSCTTVKSAMGR